MIRFWLMRVVGVVELVKPVTDTEELVAVQVNRVPLTFEVSVIFVLLLLQISLARVVLFRSGRGKTVTT